MNTTQTTTPGLADTLAWVDRLNGAQLANRADCATPDSSESAGAQMLGLVATSVVELFEYIDADDLARAIEANDPSDINNDGAVDEIADGAPSVYTHTKWKQFTDLAAYNEDPTDVGADGSNMDQAASLCLYIIADRLAHALIAEVIEELHNYDADA